MPPTRPLFHWLVLALVLVAAPPAQALLDPSFGGDGIVTTPVGTNSAAGAAAVQSDGAIVAVGGTTIAGVGQVMMVRYLTDGTLDPSFGAGGIVTTTAQAGASANGVGVQSDGKIVVAGRTTDGSTESILVIRYDDNGNLDPTFGAGGMVITTLPLTANANGLALQADDKAVVVGTVGSLDTSDVVLIRYDTDGTPDSTFDGDGIVTTEFAPPGRDAGHAVAIQNDGAIVVAGTRSAIGGGSSSKLALARYTATGALDGGFGSGGTVVTTYDSGSSGLVIQSDQKIILGGGAVGYTLARYLTDGSPDTAFGTNGIVGAGSGGPSFPILSSLALQSGDRLILGGAVVSVISLHPLTTTTDAYISRLVNDGHTFSGSDGMHLGGSGDVIFGLAIQADDKVIGTSGANNIFTVVRVAPSICGDGNLEGVEQCDDGNQTNGDGCDTNCTPTGRGNGIVTAGEQCDDHNTASGDCCSPTCQFEAVGTACGADANVCTNDVCNATAVCTHPNNTAPCDDGNACTLTDTCSGGLCAGSPMTCPLCEACSAGACVDGPRPTCRAVPAGASARLQIRDQSPDKGNQLQWKRLKAVDSPPGTFGAPLGTTQYAFCLYDESTATPALLTKLAARQGTCGTKPCWKPLSVRGWKYNDKALTPDGLATILLKGSLGGPSTLALKARGESLPLPTLPLALPARAQLQTTNGSCWEATYSPSGVQRNDGTQFNGEND